MTSIENFRVQKKNANKHTERGLEMLSESIAEYGWIGAITVAADGETFDGSARLDTVKSILNTEPIIVETDGTRPVILKRTDIESADSDKAKLLAIAANRIAQVDLSWDAQVLSDLADEIDLSGLFSEEELANILATVVDLPPEGLDDTYEIPDKVVTSIQPGDYFEIGKHRLLCGDATKIESWARVMGNHMADLVITDPPYNVAYVGKTKDALTIQNDRMGDENFYQFLLDFYNSLASYTKPGGCWYVWHADSEGANFRRAMDAAGIKVRQCLIWVKNHMVMSRQDYHWKHEPCQPAGTLVSTIQNGAVPIESLKDGDKVFSFDSCSQKIVGHWDGLSVKTASRQYDGTLYGVRVGDQITWATDTHKFTVRYPDGEIEKDVWACELITGVHQLPIPANDWKSVYWIPITAIEHKPYSGLVYSLDVERFEHYIADGIVTHNCLYGWKEGAAHGWYSDRKQVTVLNFDRPSRNADHPTMKPIELLAYQMGNSSKAGDIIADGFLGSGSTMVAAHMNNRICYGLELDPVYCQVIVDRMRELDPGIQIKLNGELLPALVAGEDSHVSE